MAPLDVVALARRLIDVDSTTGNEGKLGRQLASLLRDRGWTVVEQPVSGDRANVFASMATPDVVFSTHFDCVPPFFPSSERDGLLLGRGSCDAKGILAAQLVAAERLVATGEHRVGLLFVVGEERGSDGALRANQLEVTPRYLVDGEPTDCRLGQATRGILRLRFEATGRAAHSSYPELGESAIEKLLDALVDLRNILLPDDAVLGRTHYSIGMISGGVAPNVIPAQAEAEIMFRTVGPGKAVRAVLVPLESRITIHHVLEVPPVRLVTVEGFETATFPYTTDIPLLDRWGQPLLFGPGSVFVAHTADEHVRTAELREAVDQYVALARLLLGRPPEDEVARHDAAE